ncbi:hypothetical protein B0H13DRAFT_1949183 [Mycena leptocephala]|nr:hypothetical protein B0H13DRAFT_1949183 [Mycena leptocephala]
MTSLRQRVGFQAADDDNDGQRVVISNLRQQNTQTNARALLLLDGVLVFSALLQIVYLLKDSKASPILALFPAAIPEPDPPCPTAFALLALALHANLALHLHPTPSATAWAAVPLAVVALTHSMQSSLQEGDEALAELEALKYRAPGP